MNPNNIVKIIGTIIVLALAGLVVMNTKTTQQATTATTIETTQEVTLSWGKLNYNPEVITVKAGEKVRITGDMTRLTGCFQSLQIPELGISKSMTETDNVLEFTPTKKGTFAFGCAMGMGAGKLVVI